MQPSTNSFIRGKGFHYIFVKNVKSRHKFFIMFCLQNQLVIIFLFEVCHKWKSKMAKEMICTMGKTL